MTFGLVYTNDESIFSLRLLYVMESISPRFIKVGLPAAYVVISRNGMSFVDKLEARLYTSDKDRSE
jgi:hypothetical protein